MSRRGVQNFQRGAQQPTIQDQVFKESTYKEWHTHELNTVPVKGWGDVEEEEKAAGYGEQKYISAYSKQYAPHAAFAHCDKGLGDAAGKPSELLLSFA